MTRAAARPALALVALLAAATLTGCDNGSCTASGTLQATSVVQTKGGGGGGGHSSGGGGGHSSGEGTSSGSHASEEDTSTGGGANVPHPPVTSGGSDCKKATP